MFNKNAIAGFSLTFAVSLSFCHAALGQTQPGYTFHVTVRSEIPGKKNDPPLLFNASVVGEKGRVDVIQGDDHYKTGDYLLTDDRGETFWIVSTKKKEAKRFTPEQLRKEVTREKFNLTDISLVAPTSTGQSEAVGGVFAEVYRSLRRYTISGRQLIWTFRIEIEENWSFSIAPNRSHLPAFNPVVSFFAMTGSAPLFKDAGYAGSGYKSAVPPGMPLKAVAVTTTKEKKKQETETTIITSDAPVATSLDSALFVVPDGVKRKE